MDDARINCYPLACKFIFIWFMRPTVIQTMYSFFFIFQTCVLFSPFLIWLSSRPGTFPSSAHVQWRQTRSISWFLLLFFYSHLIRLWLLLSLTLLIRMSGHCQNQISSAFLHMSRWGKLTWSRLSSCLFDIQTFFIVAATEKTIITTELSSGNQFTWHIYECDEEKWPIVYQDVLTLLSDSGLSNRDIC